jgi:hypothetical protein
MKRGKFMGNILLFTLIIGIASALILIPIFTKDQISKKEGKILNGRKETAQQAIFN